MFPCFRSSRCCAKPLQPPCDAPYRVLKRSMKHYTIDCKRHPDCCLDWLKAAHINSKLLVPQSRPQQQPLPISSPPSQPHRVTHLGHHVHWPDRLVHGSSVAGTPGPGIGHSDLDCEHLSRTFCACGDRNIL